MYNLLTLTVSLSQVVHVVQQLGELLANMHSRQADIVKRVMGIEATQQRMEQKMDTLISLLSNGARASSVCSWQH